MLKATNISKPVASESIFCLVPRDEHVLTATCAPGLRYVCHPMWNFCRFLGSPFLDGLFPAKTVTFQAVPSDVPSEEAKAAPAYRPPALRDKPALADLAQWIEHRLRTEGSQLHEKEPQLGSKPLSKTALKNQRKHEAKKAEKQEARSDKSLDLAPTPAPRSSTRNTISQPTSGYPEVDKKIQNLKKKLKASEQLKEQAATGKQLGKNQLKKIQKEKGPSPGAGRFGNRYLKIHRKQTTIRMTFQTKPGLQGSDGAARGCRGLRGLRGPAEAEGA
ncbi:hypothetical protein QTO34_004550, partial [Cnephaeus nilssonii]